MATVFISMTVIPDLKMTAKIANCPGKNNVLLLINETDTWIRFRIILK